MFNITIEGALTGTDREQEFKESELVGKVKKFIEQLPGLDSVTMTLDQRGSVTLVEGGNRVQMKLGGIYDDHITDAVPGYDSGS